MRGKWRAYIKPFDSSGAYADWVEVTDDVVWGSVGTIRQGLDNTEYDIGIYRNSNFNLTLRNASGRYSDINVLQSIFRYKRSDSQFKLTWETQEGPYCGLPDTICGEFECAEEMTLFEGLLNDESLAMDLESQEAQFVVLGLESILGRTSVPFASVSNGDLISEVILACLDQAGVTTLLTVSASNVSVGEDQTLDDVAKLETMTVKEALDQLLLLSSSVLYIRDREVIVSPRTPGATVAYTFFGQASNDGPENIQNLTRIKNGLGRVFNYLVWENTTIVADDESSVDTYGVRKKEFSSSFFTTGAKQQALLDAIVLEFAVPKREFDLSTPLNYQTLEIGLLDRVNADYPTVYVSLAQLPICGIAICGAAVLPRGVWGFSLTTTEDFKVIGRELDIKNGLFKFKLREV